ncbi:Short-chain dehydrogenase [Amycolatopsis xylanica]|uniref:Short-chain dehydrogenase n=1 Tax=Amycolatopsis xylanica TaxID=589385 RepID=A0A1H3DR60_9PSEU|nr:SDR family NAD(P)-dependent oxidoreductase [Amycolatopsis xylanica]SDX68905.1 Short-chain dehydrogenase [Amycolatopsis xylanica]
MTRVALITGTSSGIGLAAAVQAAKAGYRTVATMRDLSRAGKLRAAAAEAGVELDIRALDVTEDPSAVVAAVLADHGRIDVLVNNAGAGHVGTVEQDSVENFRKTMEVNFFGVVQLTKLVMPALRATGGRLITVTSVGGIVGQPFNEAYCAAKFAVEGMMESLAPLAESHGVKVSVIEPGAVATEFVNNVGLDLETAIAAAGPYGDQFRNYVSRTMQSFSAAQTPDEVAEVILKAMTDESPAFRIQTSQWAEGFTGLKLADQDGSAVQKLTGGWVA